MPCIIIDNATNQELHRLGKRPLVIGRDQACAAQVLDEHVSRKHLQIRFEPSAGTYHALDMKSENGTRVNDRQIAAGTEIELVDGDRLEIGRTRILFTNEEHPDLRSAFNQWHQPGERGKSTIQHER